MSTVKTHETYLVHYVMRLADNAGEQRQVFVAVSDDEYPGKLVDKLAEAAFDLFNDANNNTADASKSIENLLADANSPEKIEEVRFNSLKLAIYFQHVQLLCKNDDSCSDIDVAEMRKAMVDSQMVAKQDVSAPFNVQLHDAHRQPRIKNRSC